MVTASLSARAPCRSSTKRLPVRSHVALAVARTHTWPSSVRYSNHIWRLIVEEEEEEEKDLFDDVITNHILLRDEASLIFVH